MNRLQKLNVLLLAGGQSLFTVATITTMAISSIIGQQLAPSPGLATMPAAMMMLSTLLTTLPASLLMKRIGRRRGFVIGTLNGATGGLVCFTGIAAGSFALFCLGTFFIGLYQSFAMYYRFAATDATEPAFRSRAVSYVMAGGVIAAIIGPLNARLALDWVPSVPYGGPFLVILGLSLVAAMLVNRLNMAEPGDLNTEASRPIADIARHPAFFPAMLCSGICFPFMVLFMTVTPLAMQAQGFDMTEITIVTQSQVLAMFVPAFITGHLISRHGLNRILLTGAGLMLTAALIGAFAASVPIYVLSRLCVGIGWNFLFVGSAVLLSTTHRPAERGKVQGLNDQFIFLLVTIACLGAASALKSMGWQNLNLLAGASVLIAIAALVRMVHRQHRLSEDETTYLLKSPANAAHLAKSIAQNRQANRASERGNNEC